MPFSVRFVFLEKPAGLQFQDSRFKATYSQTLHDLQRELEAIDARDVTIQAGYRQVRADGWPYASAKPEHPAVTLQFRRGLSQDVLTFHGKQYSTFDDNLRAITLSLEALRAVDRYGVVNGQQYTGFKQLAGPDERPVDAHTAAATLTRVSGIYVSAENIDREALDRAYKLAARRTHPDVAGGSQAAFLQVQQAYEVLKKAL
jgi:hypothetical protein